MSIKHNSGSKTGCMPALGFCILVWINNDLLVDRTAFEILDASCFGEVLKTI